MASCYTQAAVRYSPEHSGARQRIVSPRRSALRAAASSTKRCATTALYNVKGRAQPSMLGFRSGSILGSTRSAEFLKARASVCNARRALFQVIRASIFGVGAPEAFVIGVVALLVFGPKGLAEAAKALGKTLRAFQPTIKEIQEVSSDFRNTLEEEIGLEDIRQDIRSVKDSLNPTAPLPRVPTPTRADNSSPADKKSDDSKVTEEMKAASAASAWGGAPPEPTAAAPPANSANEAVAPKVAEVLESAESGKLPNLAELDKVVSEESAPKKSSGKVPPELSSTD